ncbi:MAG: NAD-dependent DNA ligase LigA [bacterium]
MAWIILFKFADSNKRKYISFMDAKDRIKDLVDRLNYHSHRYHNLDDPEISDVEYDELFNELKELEEKHPQYILDYSPTQKVGAAILKDFAKIKHRVPMLSLSNIFNYSDLEGFDQRVKKILSTDINIEYIVEPKLDGLALAIQYEKGIFTRAATRGDGDVGEDVTENVRTIKNIPLKLLGNQHPDTFEVRGEVIINDSDFEKLNAEKSSNEEKTFANSRNAAAGSIRQLDSKITAERPLRFYVHSFTHEELFKTHKEALEQAKKWGFMVHNSIKVISDLKEIALYFTTLMSNRRNIGLGIDGVVIKVNDTKLQKELGNIARSPRWAVAWKPPAHTSRTKVNNIKVQVGRTGVLTPVAELEPVEVGGVEIKRATLHNASDLEKKDVRIGDTVVIERAGDVIPAIVRVIDEPNKQRLDPYKFPERCPSCMTQIIRDGVNFICPNINCPERNMESLSNFVGRNAMNIDGVGYKLIEQLVERNLVRTFSDIYRLNEATLLMLDRMGQKSAKNAIDSINKSKRVTLDRFINALGIELIGAENSKELAKRFNNIEDLFYIKAIDLENIDGFGPNIIESLVNFFKDEKNIKEIQQLISLGINTSNVPSILGNKLSSLSFVITGSFNEMSREQIKELIESNGGKVSSSISKKTSYLVLGEDPGSKLDKAKELDIKTIDLKSLENLIN